MFSSCSFVSIVSILFIQPTTTENNDNAENKTNRIITIIIVFICLLAFMITIFGDPGICIPNKRRDEMLIRIERLNHHYHRNNNNDIDAITCDLRRDEINNIWTRKMNRTTNVDNSGDDDEQEREKYCEVCNIWRPKKVSHCKTCNVCVRGFDHHCGAINNCIGDGNSFAFLVFIVTESYLAVSFFWRAFARLETFGFPFYESSWRKPFVFLIAFIAFVCLHGACMSLFSLFHIYLYVRNVTTKELSDYLKSRGGYRNIIVSASFPSSSSSSSVGYLSQSNKPPFSLVILNEAISLKRRVCKSLMNFRLKSQTMLKVYEIRKANKAQKGADYYDDEEEEEDDGSTFVL